MTVVRRLLVRLAWLVVATLVALGSAGVVASMNHVPATDARAELTWAVDTEVHAALDAATEQLQTLHDEVERLGSSARQALAAVVAGDPDDVNDTIAAGTAQLAAVTEAAALLEASVAVIPGLGDGSALAVSPELRIRYDQLQQTNGLTGGLETDWALFTGRALDANTLGRLLGRHDEETAAAAQHGAAAEYRAALDRLAASDATIAQIRTLADRLAPTTDVSTLTAWVDRVAAYDAALRVLYETLLDADGEVTDAVRDAYADEQRARANLPGDTRPLIVIMADVAQGGLNQAAISIEDTRVELADALEVQRSFEEDIVLPE